MMINEIKCKVKTCKYCDCDNWKCELEKVVIKPCEFICDDKECTMCDSFKER